MQLKEVLQLFSHEQLKEIITTKIKRMWLFVNHNGSALHD